jgi:hypothetical protein
VVKRGDRAVPDPAPAVENDGAGSSIRLRLAQLEVDKQHL